MNKIDFTGSVEYKRRILINNDYFQFLKVLARLSKLIDHSISDEIHT
jgi:hypothetical protein